MPISDFDVRKFELFGFVVVRNVLTAAECRQVAGEFGRAFRGAFENLPARRTPAWLPGLGDATPCSAALTVDDGRLWSLAHRLLGCEPLPCPPEVAWLHGITPWHYDDPLELRGVKFLVYPVAPSAGLHLLPMSHKPENRAAVRKFLTDSVGQGLTVETPTEAAELDLLPAVAVSVSPGDVIAIDLHVWYCYRLREPRILWAPEYLAWPVEPSKSNSMDQKFTSLAAAGGAEDGRCEWPVWREWIRATPLPDRRRRAIELLGASGAFHNGRDLL